MTTPASENVNVNLSVTVPAEHQRLAVRLLSNALTEVVTGIPDLISGSVSIFRDDFVEAEEATTTGGDIHIVETAGVDVESLVRQASQPARDAVERP